MIDNRTEPFHSSKIWKNLCSEEQQFISQKAEEYKLTYQQIKQIIDIAADLYNWDEGSLSDLWPDSKMEEPNKKIAKKMVSLIESKWLEFKTKAKSYKDFHLSEAEGSQVLSYEKSTTPGNILGRCPVASERTRCCNLMTLDAVTGCAFDCSYCSIQTFYTGGKVHFEQDLRQRLLEIEESELKTGRNYHIGTGQSSDSLLWGNKDNLLQDLFAFALRNPHVVLELKTKSNNIQYLLDNPVPPNVVVTWSLNTETIVNNEERLSASLNERISAAREVANKGILVGFHFHPIVDYKEGSEEYPALYHRITTLFTPEEVCMISFGTLTYIKPVIKKLRQRKVHTKILQMPLEDAEGKFSYPFETKLNLFQTAYNSFKEWHNKVFFYMCMEDKRLWEPVFGRSYPTNEDFEQDMIASYQNKIKMLQHRDKPIER